MLRWIIPLLVFLMSGMWGPYAQAHDVRPAFLSITETANARYDILWKTPVFDGQKLALEASFPKACKVSGGWHRLEKNKFSIQTWQLTCPISLHGQSVRIVGLEKTLTDVLVKTRWANGETSITRLTPTHTTLKFQLAGNRAKTGGGVVATYFSLGVGHILSGIDHLLFVLAVMLLVTRPKKLFFAVTAFTLGHSVTLVLATFGILSVNPGLVEVLIAMSIVLMAYEAARRWQGRSGLTLEHPWVVTFSFGLLHGFGFAGALRDIGLPHTDIPAALLFFNLGVEVGQLMFIFCVLLVAGLAAFLCKSAKLRAPTALALSYCIGTLAVFWTLQRAWPLFLIPSP